VTVTTTVCPRVVGASDDGREMVLCGSPLPCAAHGRVVRPVFTVPQADAVLEALGFRLADDIEDTTHDRGVYERALAALDQAMHEAGA
jgi:hypothetical protein